MLEFIQQNTILLIIGIVTAVIVTILFSLLISLIKKRKKKKSPENELEIIRSSKAERVNQARALVAPDGINPIPLSYMTLNDNGTDVFVRSFTIDSLPKRTLFASTFPVLFNFHRIHSSVFIEPLGEGKASHILDSLVVDIESNMITAEKNSDRNQVRKLHTKLNEAEKWAQKIETGENSFYHAYFLFTLMEDSLEKLNQQTDAFRNLAKEKKITIACIYGLQAEAYLSGMPMNFRYKGSAGLLNAMGLKRHNLDKLSISSIFNHTHADFFHRNGIVIGRNMSTWLPIAYDCYDQSHNGYSVCFTGMTGTGKSATMKILASRYISRHGYRFVNIDSQQKGDRGEYSMLTDVQSGVNFIIKANSNNIMNPFELSEEEEWSEVKGEYLALYLLDKIYDAKASIMTLIKGSKNEMTFETETFLERILIDIITELYDDIGIRDNDVDSLYIAGTSIKGGILSSGKVRKKLPTISDLYKKALIKSKHNEIQEHKKPYQILLDALKDRVKELYYCKECLHFYSSEEYKNNYKCKCGNKITAIRGIKNYYDGQSTVSISLKNRITNIDISGLPKEEKPIARQIAMSLTTEQFIKKNAVNPRKTQCLAVIADEVHENFNHKYCVESLDYVVRTSRKRLVSLWTATQALKDYDCCRETEALLKQSVTKFVFKQSYQDRDWIKKALNLTRGQVERVLDLGGDPTDLEQDRKGEVCLCDNGKVVFCKIDYMKSAEAVFVETDPRIIQQMYH